MLIKTYSERLTDGSEVFNLVISQDNQQIELRTCSERDALALADKLADAILLHTVECATVR
jgi:hypothetical protein